MDYPIRVSQSMSNTLIAPLCGIWAFHFHMLMLRQRNAQMLEVSETHFEDSIGNYSNEHRTVVEVW